MLFNDADSTRACQQQTTGTFAPFPDSKKRGDFECARPTSPSSSYRSAGAASLVASVSAVGSVKNVELNGVTRKVTWQNIQELRLGIEEVASAVVRTETQLRQEIQEVRMVLKANAEQKPGWNGLTGLEVPSLSELVLQVQAMTKRAERIEKSMTELASTMGARFGQLEGMVEVATLRAGDAKRPVSEHPITDWAMPESQMLEQRMRMSERPISSQAAGLVTPTLPSYGRAAPLQQTVVSRQAPLTPRAGARETPPVSEYQRQPQPSLRNSCGGSPKEACRGALPVVRSPVISALIQQYEPGSRRVEAAVEGPNAKNTGEDVSDASASHGATMPAGARDMSGSMSVPTATTLQTTLLASPLASPRHSLRFCSDLRVERKPASEVGISLSSATTPRSVQGRRAQA